MLFFGWNEGKEQRTSLEIEEDGIRILKVVRNRKEETVYLEKLKSFPLHVPENRQQFELTGGEENPYALLEWVARNRKKLETAGFHINAPTIDDKKLQLSMATINMEVETASDWFDLKGEIKVGEYSFPFMKLVKYIRDENRFFPLPDGTFFLIPEEWMAKYKGLTDFGKNAGEKLRLTKSQYTLLEDIGLDQKEVEQENLPVFVPSNLLNATLRPYQQEGAQWLANLYHQDLGACLADDMGLGKTLQTIAILLYAKEQKALALKENKGST